MNGPDRLDINDPWPALPGFPWLGPDATARMAGDTALRLTACRGAGKDPIPVAVRLAAPAPCSPGPTC